ncbi:MAG: ribosome hibernation-promoting factor, HPF/YfiA family [Gaiellaceae bacterium]
MQLHVKGKNLEVGESIRRYGEDKLRKLERILDDGAEIELELAEERNPSIAASHVAEATVRTRRAVVRARESSPDMKSSIDQLVDKLERQIKKEREKRRRRPQRVNGQPTEPEAQSEGEPPIVRTKQFALKPMTPEEAVLQLELVGHDFFVFTNAESGDVNVVYRRKDRGYGLIEPQV